MDLYYLNPMRKITGVYGRRGEVQAARAASKAQIPFSLSTVSICSLEEVAQNSQAPFWFQVMQHFFCKI